MIYIGVSLVKGHNYRYYMIYFDSIRIKGYKGFTDSGDIGLNVPDGTTPGSGLNIFVGENGAGKTTLLKAISFLVMSSSGGQSKVSLSDFNMGMGNDENIEITGKLSVPVDYMMVDPWKQSFKVKEFKTQIKTRDRKSPGKLLSSKFTISNILEPTSRRYSWYRKGFVEISDFYLGFDNDRFIDDESLNIFFYDSNRSKQSRKGFSTTFSRVMDDLNWKFLKDAKQKEVLEKWNEYCTMLKIPDIGSGIKEIFKDKFGREDLENIHLELLNLKEPHSEAFFGICSKDNLTQIPLSELGSGIELLFSILFLRQLANQSKGTIIYCIDEPELSLHPQWQKIFFDILKEEAKTKQIFIATHSLHFIDQFNLGSIKKFKHQDDGNIAFSSFTEANLVDGKISELFSLENRELFFSRGVVLVEGWEDRKRIRGFLESCNNDMFVMDGLQNLDRMKSVCEALSIPFKAIVDLDYLRKFKNLIPDLTPEEMENLEEIQSLEVMEKSTTDEKVIKEISKIKSKILGDKLKCLSSKMRLKMEQDPDYIKAVMQKIKELKEEKIFVLPSGMIEDYLDSSSKPLSTELSSELHTILIS